MEESFKDGNIEVHMCGCDFGKEFEVLKDVMWENENINSKWLL